MPRHVHEHDAPYGAPPPVRALFVDRWGTLLELPSGDGARSPADVRFFPGAVDALWRAQRAGWRIYLIGNEDHVAFGRTSPKDFERVDAAILAGLEARGVVPARQYICTSHPRGVAGRRGDSVYRLPNTGAFYHAQHHDDVRLRESWVIGDGTLEHVAGWRAGVRRAAVRTGLALGDAEFEVEVDMFADDLVGVVGSLLVGSWKVAA